MYIKDIIQEELKNIENEFEMYANIKGNNHIMIDLQYVSIPRETDVNTYDLNIATKSLFYIKEIDWDNNKDRTFQVRTSIFVMHKEKIFDELLNCLYGGSVRILDEYIPIKENKEV